MKFWGLLLGLMPSVSHPTQAGLLVQASICQGVSSLTPFVVPTHDVEILVPSEIDVFPLPCPWKFPVPPGGANLFFLPLLKKVTILMAKIPFLVEREDFP